MKKITLFLISITLCIGVFAQDAGKTKDTSDLKKCGQFEALEKMQTEDPARYQLYQQSRIDLEQETEASTQRSGTIYTIPVVFHVLHNNGTENISDQQIQSALDILNRDYRKLNSDVNSVYSTFLPISSDSKIEFVFAKKAPNGDCFNGITRTVSTETSNGGDGMSQVNAIINGNDIYQGVWPHNQYLNIYVCKDIGGSAGYTYKPNGGSTATNSSMRYNGIFLKDKYCGSIGTSSVYRSRTLTHEVGHWLNLSHIWGNGNSAGVVCGDDLVSDTPITKGFSPCPSSPNDAKICNPPIVENYENYMDYTRCRKMFTQGQSSRMRTAIVSNVAGRNNIWTTTNLQNVGAAGFPMSLCNAQIDASPTVLCEGSSVAFSLSGATEPITSYLWTFSGGYPATSTIANPIITYSTPGSYDVTLSITTSSGSKVINNSSYIIVHPNRTVIPLPITEGFVNTSFPPPSGGWTVSNGGNPTTWKRSTEGTLPTANNSATLEFDPGTGTNTEGDIDDLNTPAFSLNGYSSATLTFDVAYRQFTDLYSDKLEVLISPECGMPYNVIYSKESTVLQTEPEGYGYPNPTVWRNDTIDLTPFIGYSEVKIKFRGISGWGNQIYIDNINISTDPVGTFTSSTNTVCQGETVTYTTTTTGSTSWDWDFGVDASPATATGIGPHIVTYSSSGSKTVTLSTGGVVTSSSQTVLVNTLPNTTLSAFPIPCVNDSPIPLTQGSPAGGTYSGDGVDGGNQFYPSIAGIGSHTITYTFTSSTTGCTNSANNQITVDGCLGINDETSQLFKIFPNPTTGNVTISSSYLINNVLVFDNVGRVVFTLNHVNNKYVTMDLGTLSKGVYIVQTGIGSDIRMNRIVVE